LADLCGRPLLGWLIERMRPSRLVSRIVVATTGRAADDAIVDFCDSAGVDVFRGPDEDVLRRFALVAEAYSAPALVRISADSPLHEAAVVDYVVADFLRGKADIVENHRVPDWPLGTAVEVFTAGCLARLESEATDRHVREHVTLFAYENPRRYRIRHVDAPRPFRAPSLRICIDSQGDLDYLRQICSRFAPRYDFGLAEVVSSSTPAAR
jgi:spore coat polysaccharide biosynthesis protein SpsF